MINDFIEFCLTPEIPDIIKIAFIIKYFGGKNI